MLKLNPKNPRRISPDHLAKLASSIQNFPKMMELRPIVYDPETMQVLGGNQRLHAIKNLKMTEIPDSWVRSAADLTSEEKKAFIIKDNITLGEWDFEALELDFAEFDLAEMGIDIGKIEKYDGSGESSIDGVSDEQELNKTLIKTGDVIRIGKHTLICGDSTDPLIINKFDDPHTLTLTDPPYSVNYENIRRKLDAPTRKESNSTYVDPPADEVLKFISTLKSDLLVMTYPLAKHFHLLAQMTTDWDMLYELVWVKNTFAFNMYKNYQQQHEMIMIFRKKKHGKTVMNVPKNQSTVLECDKPLANPEHPTIKPTALYESLVEFHSNPGDTIFEPFSGSGTTMLACENRKRVCNAIEICPQYCQACINKMLANHPDLKVTINDKDYIPNNP